MTTIEAHKTYSAEAVYDRYREQFKSTLCPTSIPYEVQKKLLQEYQETNKLQGRNITRSQDSTNGQINNCIRILNASVQQIQNDKEEKMAPYRKQFEKTKSTDSIPLDIQWDMVIYYKEMADRLPSSEEMRSLYKEYVNILDESYNQFVQFQIAILDPLFEYIDEKSSNEEETHHTSPEILSFYESAKEYLNEFKRRITSPYQEQPPSLEDFFKERKSESFVNMLEKFTEDVKETLTSNIEHVAKSANANSDFLKYQRNFYRYLYQNVLNLLKRTQHDLSEHYLNQFEKTKSTESIPLRIQEQLLTWFRQRVYVTGCIPPHCTVELTESPKYAHNKECIQILHDSIRKIKENELR